MTNAELINRLREVPCWDIGTDVEETMLDAADALEAAEKQVNEFIKNETHSSVIKAMSRRIEELEADKKTLINVVKDKSDFHATKDAIRIAELEKQMPKEGEWIIIGISVSGSSTAKCSKCGAIVHDSFTNTPNYCPNCGAKMKGEKHDTN